MVALGFGTMYFFHSSFPAILAYGRGQEETMPGFRSTLAWMGVLALSIGPGCAGPQAQSSQGQSPQGHWRAEAIAGAAIAGGPPTTPDLAEAGRTGTAACREGLGQSE